MSSDGELNGDNARLFTCSKRVKTQRVVQVGSWSSTGSIKTSTQRMSPKSNTPLDLVVEMCVALTYYACMPTPKSSMTPFMTTCNRFFRFCCIFFPVNAVVLPSPTLDGVQKIANLARYMAHFDKHVEEIVEVYPFVRNRGETISLGKLEVHGTLKSDNIFAREHSRNRPQRNINRRVEERNCLV